MEAGYSVAYLRLGAAALSWRELLLRAFEFSSRDDLFLDLALVEDDLFAEVVDLGAEGDGLEGLLP